MGIAGKTVQKIWRANGLSAALTHISRRQSPKRNPTASWDNPADGDFGYAERMRPQIVVHHLAQAQAALAAAAELGVEVQLRSAPDAAGFAGVGYLKALGEVLGHELVVDCGDDAGLVMAALRIGCRKLAFAGGAELSQRLEDMAAELHAEFCHDVVPPDVLGLGPDDDAHARCLAWLAAACQNQ